MKQSRPIRRRSAPRAATNSLRVGRRSIRLSNSEKVLYPRTGFTKQHVIDYYLAVVRYLLPHLRDRPIRLKRYPDGVKGQLFYEKDAPTFRPPGIRGRMETLWACGPLAVRIGHQKNCAAK
jgi:DNA primase